MAFDDLLDLVRDTLGYCLQTFAPEGKRGRELKTRFKKYFRATLERRVRARMQGPR